jgi:hypothetical protein
MTAPTMTTTLSTDDDELLIEEARRQRRSRRSGRLLAGLLALAVSLGAAGFLMAVHPGAITYSTPYSSSFPLGGLLSVFGGLSFVLAIIFLLGVARGWPRGPWGDPAPGECPACGHPALRQDDIVLWAGANTLKAMASGTVTLCETPGCPHATARLNLADGLPGP